MGEVYAGTVVSGTVSVGDRLLLGPTGPDGAFLRTAVASVHVARLAVRRASAGQTASFTLVTDPDPDPAVPAAAAASAGADDDNDDTDVEDDDDAQVGRRSGSVTGSGGIAGLGPRCGEAVVGAVAAFGGGAGGDAGNGAPSNGSGRGGAGEGCGDEGLRAEMAAAGVFCSTLLSTSRAQNAPATTAAAAATGEDRTCNGGSSHPATAAATAAAAAAGVPTHGSEAADHHGRVTCSPRGQRLVENGDSENNTNAAREARTTPGESVVLSPPRDGCIPSSSSSPVLPQLLVPTSPEFGGEGGGGGTDATSPLVLDASGGESPGMRPRKGMVLIEVRERVKFFVV